MGSIWSQWQIWAVLAAITAALTSLLAKIGVQGIPSNLATLLRTVVVLLLLVAVVFGRGEWQSPLDLPRRSLLFLLFSGLATGVSWLCWFRAIQLGPLAQVAPIDKLSVVIVADFRGGFAGGKPQPLAVAGRGADGWGCGLAGLALSRPDSQGPGKLSG
jgi:bacterial/archaeal transporter family protein